VFVVAAGAQVVGGQGLVERAAALAGDPEVDPKGPAQELAADLGGVHVLGVGDGVAVVELAVDGDLGVIRQA